MKGYMAIGFAIFLLGANASAADLDREIKEVCKVDKKCYQAFTHFQRSVSAGKLGQYDRALKEVNKAIESWPHYPGFIGLRGLIHADLGNNLDALKDLTLAIDHLPSDKFSAQHSLARCRLLTFAAKTYALLKTARSDCYTARKWGVAGPVGAILCINAGLQRDFKRAILECGEIVRLQPGEVPAAHYVLGLAKVKTGNVSAGEADIRGAEKLLPGIGNEYAAMVAQLH